jgi:hypothetical protein
MPSSRFAGDMKSQNEYSHSFNLKIKFDLLVAIRHILAVNKCDSPAANHILTIA